MGKFEAGQESTKVHTGCMAETQPPAPARSDPSKDRDVFVKNRLKFIDYVRRVHEEKTFWMNAVWVSREDIKTYLTLTELVDRYVEAVVMCTGMRHLIVSVYMYARCWSCQGTHVL
jgi:hypothetical protein